MNSNDRLDISGQPAGLLERFAGLPDGEPARLVGRAEALYRQRRQRETYFDDGLFGEPGWDILLDLYVQQARGRQVSISSLCIAASVPSTTALRYIDVLAARGWVVRSDDPYDRRRCLVHLSAKGVEAMRDYLMDLLIGDAAK